ncbi:MAG: hypothetical protein ABSF26_09145 [Thermoguttaceae bacterium]
MRLILTFLTCLLLAPLAGYRQRIASGYRSPNFAAGPGCLPL